MPNFLQTASHLRRYFEMRQRRSTIAMKVTAAQRKVSYVDLNADPGSGRRDYQDSTVSQLRGRAAAANRQCWSYSIAAHPLINRSRTLFHAS
jgi:hypothetical protein